MRMAKRKTFSDIARDLFQGLFPKAQQSAQAGDKEGGAGDHAGGIPALQAAQQHEDNIPAKAIGVKTARNRAAFLCPWGLEGSACMESLGPPGIQPAPCLTHMR